MGDKNIKFFHVSTLIHRNRNKILGLKDKEGYWVMDAEILKETAISHFSNLFSLENDTSGPITTIANFPWWSQEDLCCLGKNFYEEEVRNAIFSMSPYKAPGLDGFQPIFFPKTLAYCES